MDVKEKDTMFCKRAIGIILNAGRRKYDALVNKFAAVNAVKHGAIGERKIAANAKAHKDKHKKYAKKLAEQYGESCTARFEIKEKRYSHAKNNYQPSNSYCASLSTIFIGTTAILKAA